MGQCFSRADDSNRRNEYASTEKHRRKQISSPIEPEIPKPQFYLILECASCPPGRCLYTGDVNYNGETLAYRETEHPRPWPGEWRLRIDFCGLANMRQSATAKDILRRFMRDRSMSMGSVASGQQHAGRAGKEKRREPFAVDDLLRALDLAGVRYVSSV
ncbi:hypothetical protein MMYC01_202641 [Madurella mycetomatis]|uniref:Uncharacterized protein n=1 Tax=Madurella mycetomatis TaxID=100816 RepID=A0A175WCG2_9PEZI|nr:hypothetical protein MMYC01_202641 [Madurella mycetomatis]